MRWRDHVTDWEKEARSRHSQFCPSKKQTTFSSSTPAPLIYTPPPPRRSPPPSLLSCQKFSSGWATMSLNATIAQSAAHITSAQLYAGAGTDFASLNWFEQQWAGWYLWIGNPIIATGLASFLLHEVCLCCWHISFEPRGLMFSCSEDCVLRPLRPMDDHRLHPVFPKVEVAACQNSHHR